MKVYDIAIVGAGAAGMTAALYALRAHKTVIIFEQTTFGGQIINTHKIENYPAAPSISGVDFAKNLKTQVESFGGEFEFSSAEKIDKTPEGFKIFTSDNKTFLSKTVILANGSAERRLGLDGEERLIGRGISYCATCDGGFFKDKIVAVYGGGNTALYSALYLANIAKTVFLIIRRDKFRAEPHLVKAAESTKNIEIVKNSIISSLSGDERLTAITLSVTDPKTSKKTERFLPLDGLFVSIGRVPNNEIFKNLVTLDEQGYIKSDESCQTSTPGVFCAGDTRAKTLHQLVTATSDGAVAATAAIEFLNSAK